MVNSMCVDCRRYKNECQGTKALFWTGCVWKERVKTEQRPMGRYHPGDNEKKE